MKANTKYFTSAMRTYGLESLGSPVVYTRLNASRQYPALGELRTLKGSYVKGMFELGKYLQTIIDYGSIFSNLVTKSYSAGPKSVEPNYDSAFPNKKGLKLGCPQCGVEIDNFDTCRRCGWSRFEEKCQERIFI